MAVGLVPAPTSAPSPEAEDAESPVAPSAPAEGLPAAQDSQTP